ncbi:CGH_3_collapsed_G0020930.mRNA.1.CDS.1 [Saccharomyces cerevisiae]|nr:CGH_3_collapsed_G0020930.mRNA.1.CDS.1 [Saccharomyces cerevisiae]
MFSRSDREVDDLAGNMSHLGFHDLNIPKPTSPQAQHRPARKSENGRLTPGLPRSYKLYDSMIKIPPKSHFIESLTEEATQGFSRACFPK